MNSDRPNYLRQLRQLIDKYFNLEEIKTLTFDLGLDYEHLAGETRPGKIVSLLFHLVRRGELNKLIGLLKTKRQFVQWPDMPPNVVLSSDFIALSVTGEYRDLLDPETRYLTGLIYDLSGHEGPLEYVGLRGEVQLRGTRSGTADRVERKVVDSAFSVIQMGSKGIGISGLDAPKKIPLENIQEAVANYPLFALIGDPGAGKTTTLRRLALDAAWERLHNTDAPIPWWRELPRWRDGQELTDFISEGWELALPLPVALVRGDVALYLDGLNEMGARSKDRANILKKWLKGQNHPQQAIVTCRAENYRELELEITTVLVEELDEEKIRTFAKNYLGEKADGFLKRVMPRDEWDKWKKRHLFHLARNPFMLRALTMIYAALPGGDLPSNMGIVFQNLIRVLWNREKERKTAHWIVYDEMLKALSTLAFSMMEEGLTTTVSLKYAQKYVTLTLLQVADSANIVRIDADFVSFYHQFMQEYLAAAYAVSNIENGALAKCLAHVTDYQWRELFLMIARLLDDAAVFFELFFDKLDKLILQDKEIISLLAWADMKANLAQKQAYKPASVRSWYIEFTLAHDLVPDLARDLARALTLADARALDRTLALNRALVRTLGRAHARALYPADAGTLARAHTYALGRALGLVDALGLVFPLAHALDLALYLYSPTLDLDLAKQVSQELNLLELYEALTLLQLLDAEDSYQQWRDFAQSLETIPAKYRQWQKWEFSGTELDNLGNYLQATKLLVDCLNVATVSNRQEIENRLLLPPKQGKF